MKADLTQLMLGFLDVLFPRNCVITGNAVGANSPFQFISAKVSRQLIRVEPPFCSTCGYPYFGAVMASDRSCPKCRELDPVYGQGRTVILVEGASRELVHFFKYEGARYLLRDFSILFQLCPGLNEYLKDARLVPVPLHPRKMRERGFNQSRALCELLLKQESSTELQDILVKTVDTPSQTLFTRKERVKNLRNVFRVRPNAHLQPDFRYVIVDDVFTTGSTLNSCAQTLKRAGIQRIDILTLGHG